MPKKTKKNRSELYDLCYRYMSDWEEENSEAMVAGANRILLWLNHHKNDTAHFKAAALYADENGSTGLHLIVDVDGVPFEVIDTWLKHAPETKQIRDKDGMLPLHQACVHGSSLKVVMALVEPYPKSVKETNDHGDLPFHLACVSLDPAQPFFLDILSFLLRFYPESIDDEESKNRASFHLQLQLDRIRCHFDIEDNKVITSAMCEAVNGGHYLVVKLFVNAFPGISMMPGKDGMVPLHYACSNITSLDIAMALLDEAPESATITDKWGRTPFQLLISVAKVQDKNGMLSLHFQAAHSQSLTVSSLKFLIAAYPDSIDVRDDRGMLPFQYAFINKSLSVDVVSYFVEMSINHLQRL